MLDFRRILNADLGILAFARKGEAVKAAKSRGWLAGDAVRAANRFCMFWIVCQGVGADTLRVVTRDGVVDIPHPGRW